MRFAFLALICSLCAVSRGDEIDFDTQIRPLLSDNCFHCHGPDQATREADLRLDTLAGATGDLGGYSAFAAGDSDASEAMIRILSEDPDQIMPPPESKLKLDKKQIGLLTQWVNSGAQWSEHWSFVPPAEATVPEDESGWSRNTIDRFIHARAVQSGLVPQPEASRETLIRRLALDLTGLPPTIDQIDAFVADTAEGAYERLVDRLLASPRYGEHMAWAWLNAARYADTDGFQGDPTRTMWPWRDWLVDALNRNMPFDQFTIEMLAGDLLDQATPEQVLATAFNRNHMFNGEGGRIAEETRVENVFDRAETTGTVWLGLTMTCCRCHDHKYDPITQNEYFQFYSFFDNTSETGRSGRGKTAPVLNYLTSGQRRELKEVEAQLRQIEKQINRPLDQLDQQQTAWEAELVAKLELAKSEAKWGEWWQLGPISMPGRQAFDQNLGPESTVDLQSEVRKKKWKRQSDLQEGEVFALPETLGATYFYRTIETKTPRTVQLSFGSDDAIKVFVNGEERLANFAFRAAAADQEMLEIELQKGKNELLVKIVNTGGIGGFYFRKVSESLIGLPTEIVSALKQDAAQRSKQQVKLIRDHFRSLHWPEFSGLEKQRGSLAKRQSNLKGNAITVMVMDDLPEGKRRQTRMLERGGYDKPTDVTVRPGTPQVLPGLPDQGDANRLTLARWLVAPENPLTARVTVNRYWQSFFGKGIVRSTEDFGSQGDRPTHPGLLDRLARRFVESGWNVKAMHKLMVMSSTYRQQSDITPHSLEQDPENLWYARGPRYRLPSHVLRDQALALGGLLNPKLGGPGVKTYQPEGIWAEATFGKIRYTPDSGDALYRRSLYVFWRRIVGPTMFFDGAKRQTCEVKPTRTNTPLHALTTLNETTFVESARQMAAQVMAARIGDRERLRYGFRMATARRPSEREYEVLRSRLKKLREDFSASPEQAAELLSVGQSDPVVNEEPAEMAAYTVICSILMNLDETLSKQ